MTAFDKIKNGLEEAVDYENGSLDAKSIVVSTDIADPKGKDE